MHIFCQHFQLYILSKTVSSTFFHVIISLWICLHCICIMYYLFCTLFIKGLVDRCCERFCDVARLDLFPLFAATSALVNLVDNAVNWTASNEYPSYLLQCYLHSSYVHPSVIKWCVNFNQLLWLLDLSCYRIGKKNCWTQTLN